MEQGLDAYIRQQFGLGEHDIRTYSPLALAYIGDGIYELIIRTIVTERGNKQVRKLHRETSRLVKARAQAAMMDILLPLLTEEERDVYKRGRNAKTSRMAKNATASDYHRATGMEALVGYLYLKDDMERLCALIKEALSRYTPDEHAGTEARNMYENGTGSTAESTKENMAESMTENITENTGIAAE